MTMTVERRCAYCESWTRGYLAVCSDCHGERTDAMCRLGDAERKLAAVRAALVDAPTDPDRDAWGKGYNQGVAAVADRIRRALETP